MNERVQQTVGVLAGIWIAGAMFFYCVRYSLTLYRTHQTDFDAFFSRIGAFFGADG